MTILALALACTPDPASTPSVATLTTPTAPTSPATWTFPDADTPPGDPDPDALGDAITAAAALALAFPADPLVDAYLDRFARSASPTCPTTFDDGYGGTYWADGCTAPDGTYFGGYLDAVHFVDLPTDDGTALLTGDTLGGNITLLDPDGRALDLEGTAARLTGTSVDGTTTYVQSALVGGFGLQGDDAPSWLRDGPRSVELVLTTIAVPSIYGLATVVDGAVDVDQPDGRYSVRFGEVTAANLAVGSACALEPGGPVTVRDPDGRWVEVTFHGPHLGVDEGDAQRCDGCGDAVALDDGRALPEVCADFSPWLDGGAR
ncbi:MAG: hypothetical protein R3F59_10760 [Myxococcota bacterium]